MDPSPRMTRLLDAAVEVVSGQGLRGLTHRAVDREADLPQGSCSAYLRTRAALLAALAEHVASHVTDDTRALTERITGHAPDDSGYAVSETVAMFVDWLDHPALIRTRIELGLEGARQPGLAAVTNAWSEQLVAIVEELVRRKGHPDAPERAATLVAATEGVLLRALRAEPAEREELLRRSMTLLMGALVVDVAPG